ncbi:uncharacterized protein LOC108213988 [Daucus carota subsp. sativus]|uniref:uncharacterized protein LOC108213988 n=1 Tax=Daucus carota subsp. sativus TaxID=79200 RepID=UPI0030837271
MHSDLGTYWKQLLLLLLRPTALLIWLIEWVLSLYILSYQMIGTRHISFQTVTNTASHNLASRKDYYGRGRSATLWISRGKIADIAGVIMFVGGMETERNINRVNITLLDGRLAKLRVTLWGVKATQFEMNFNLYRRKNVVLIITGLLVTKTQGIIHLTSTQATTIFYNPQYNEVRELAQNIANTFGEFICPVPCTVVSQQTGEQNMQPPYLALKELRASRLWVHQKFRTNGDIIDLVIHKRKLPAFCIGCTADESTYGDKFHCAKCGRNSQAPLHTHSLALVVSDTSGYAKLILKPYEVHQLTGSSPNEVYKRRRVVNKKATLPAAMEILRGSQCSFVVKLTPFPYTNAKGEIEVVSVIHYTKIIAP